MLNYLPNSDCSDTNSQQDNCDLFVMVEPNKANESWAKY